MEKTVEVPINMSPVVFWSAEFDNSRRHCWPDKEGTNRVDGDWDTICKGDHSPILTGVVEWLRFIHAVNRLIKDTFNPWKEDIDSSTIGGFGSPKQLARDMHSADGNHWPACEIYPDWIVFLDNEHSVVYIELHNEDLIWVAEKAYDEIQAEYGDKVHGR